MRRDALITLAQQDRRARRAQRHAVVGRRPELTGGGLSSCDVLQDVRSWTANGSVASDWTRPRVGGAGDALGGSQRARRSPKRRQETLGWTRVPLRPWGEPPDTCCRQAADTHKRGEWIAMQAPDVARAVGAAMEVASGLELAVADARVVHNSNRLALRLLPCDVLARVAFSGLEEFHAELEIGRRLADVGAPVARFSPEWNRVSMSGTGSRSRSGPTTSRHPRRSHQPTTRRHSSDCTPVWRRSMSSCRTSPTASRERSNSWRAPTGLQGAKTLDRKLLSRTLRGQTRAIGERSSAEQLLHGEPHAGNLLNTKSGPLFVDLERVAGGLSSSTSLMCQKQSASAVVGAG